MIKTKFDFFNLSNSWMAVQVINLEIYNLT